MPCFAPLPRLSDLRRGWDQHRMEAGRFRALSAQAADNEGQEMAANLVRVSQSTWYYVHTDRHRPVCLRGVRGCGPLWN